MPRLFLAIALLIGAGGCSLQRLATGAVATTLADGASVFATDEDPELVREALPFALKTYEMLLQSSPDDPGLLLATCSGFVQYAKAFVEEDAFYAEAEEYLRAQRLYERARNLYLRALDYCERGLQVEAGVGLDELRSNATASLQRVPAGSVPLLFWTGAAWGSAIGVGLDQPELVVDLPVVRAVFARCQAADPGYARVGVEEALMALESVPELLGGSRQRARHHFDNAVAASAGTTLSPFVGWATLVSIPDQNREEFDRMLESAMAIESGASPSNRLANELMHRRALYLQQHADEYFIE